MKKGFTLAEVLITLGIIGVVAAMTMPTLIANYRKKQTVTKLQKFYTIMSQALIRWETDEGIQPDDVEFTVTTDEDGKTNILSDFMFWYDNNLSKYLNNVEKSVPKVVSPRYTIALNDGSGFNGYIAGKDTIYIFYCTNYKYCATESYDGKNTFLFRIYKGRIYAGQEYNLMTREKLLNHCKKATAGQCHNCAKLIQYDGWKIDKDYPIKF